MKYPLISFCLLVYNQRDFIRSAMDGAFSQTYPNLEIIISDDYSSDGSFDLIREYVKNKRKSFHHKIILNKNKRNLGVVSHLEHVIRDISHGKLIVLGSGDDISLSNRVQIVFNAWNSNNCKICCISTDFIKFDNVESINMSEVTKVFEQDKCTVDSNTISYFIKFLLGGAGCTFAVSRDVFERFSPLGLENVEDRNIAIRSKIIGDILHVNIPTVLYRVGFGETTSIKSNKEYFLWRSKNFGSVYYQAIEDVQFYDGFTNNQKNKLIKICRSGIRFYSLLLKYILTNGINKFFLKIYIILTTNYKYSILLLKRKNL